MTMDYGRKTVKGVALLAAAAALGVAGAQSMKGGMHGDDEGGAMGGCPMMAKESAGKHGGHRRMMHGGSMGMSGGMHGSMGTMGELGLDDDQQARLRELCSQHRQKHSSRMSDMQDLREEMHTLMAKERPDPEAVRELHGRMADLHGKMMADHIRMRNEMHDTLTDEQRERMHEHMQDRRSKPDQQGHKGDRQGHHDGRDR